MKSFFSLFLQERIRDLEIKDNKFIKLNKLINWKRIDYKLYSINKNCGDGKTAGVVPYDPVKMFKSILLQQWHSLSDTELEEALNVRIDFMAFTGFSIDSVEGIPDATTFCRFRNKLVEKNLDKKLFNEINKQLSELGLKVENSQGAVLDATIVESSCGPKRTIELNEDRNENENENKTESEETKIFESADPDARWLKKGNKYHFGYKAFAVTDVEDGYIDSLHMTSANKSEVKQFENSIKEITEKGKRVYADKGYYSNENKEILKAKKLRNGIMEREFVNKPLTKLQKKKNKLISKKRYIVEQSFGTLKRIFKAERSNYIGLKKTQSQFLMKCMCYNLLKALNKIQFST